MRGDCRSGRGARPGLAAWFGLLALSAAFAAFSPAVAVAAPPNDHFANAAVLTGAPVTVTATNAGATAEAGEPSHGGQAAGQSVWWSWTAPADGPFTVDTCGSDFDTLLAVYTGASLGSLTLVKGNDDACDTESSVSFAATSGRIYWIAVDGYDDQGTVRLTVQPTISATATMLVRRGRVNATRFEIEVTRSDDDDEPQLTLVRGRTRLNVDLFLENEDEDDELSETKFRYTFEWLCSRSGSWRWTLSVRRSGEEFSVEGTLSVPRCRRQAWFVSQAKVKRDFGRDFGAAAARGLRCRPVGARRDSLAHTWRCGMVERGVACSGSFLFRYARVLQGGRIVSAGRAAAGRVVCRR